MKLTLSTALRYTFSNAKNQKRSTLIIILGVCICMIAILVLSSVMNGLQNSQLDRLRNLDSFDIVIDKSELTIDQIKSISGIENVYEFIDANVLISNIKTGKSSTARIRGIDLEQYLNSRANKDISYRMFGSDTDDMFSLSTTLQNRFGAKIGDELQVTYLRKGKTTVAPYNRIYKLKGQYVCSLSDFASNTAFISIDEIKNVFGKDSVKYGIFCNDNINSVENNILSLDSNAKITSWKDANKALYSALMLEKSLMYLFLGFVFVIISVNLKNSTRRLLDNKIGESAILRAFGMSKVRIYVIFVLQGVIATSIGSILGCIFGFIMVKNLESILNIADKLILRISHVNSYLGSLPINVVFNWGEAALIMSYILLLTVIFSLLGCRKIHKLQIMEVLSNASVKV